MKEKASRIDGAFFLRYFLKKLLRFPARQPSGKECCLARPPYAFLL